MVPEPGLWVPEPILLTGCVTLGKSCCTPEPWFPQQRVGVLSCLIYTLKWRASELLLRDRHWMSCRGLDLPPRSLWTPSLFAPRVPKKKRAFSLLALMQFMP